MAARSPQGSTAVDAPKDDSQTYSRDSSAAPCSPAVQHALGLPGAASTHAGTILDECPYLTRLLSSQKLPRRSRQPVQTELFNANGKRKSAEELRKAKRRITNKESAHHVRIVRAREQEGMKEEVACLVREFELVSQDRISLQAAHAEAVKQIQSWRRQWQQAMRCNKMLLAHLDYTTQDSAKLASKASSCTITGTAHDLSRGILPGAPRITTVPSAAHCNAETAVSQTMNSATKKLGLAQETTAAKLLELSHPSNDYVLRAIGETCMGPSSAAASSSLDALVPLAPAPPFLAALDALVPDLLGAPCQQLPTPLPAAADLSPLDLNSPLATLPCQQHHSVMPLVDFPDALGSWLPL